MRIYRRWHELGERRPELLLVTAFGLAAAVIAVLLKLGSEIAEGETLALDRAILVWVRAATGGSGDAVNGLRQTMLDVTTLGGRTVLTIVVVLACGLLLALRRYLTAVMLAAQTSAGTALVGAAKHLFGRARPDVVPHFAPFSSTSFPSGHAADSAIVYLSVAVLLATATPHPVARGYILVAGVLLTVGIGFSRIYLGVHWPSDVLAGWTLGAGWALAVGVIAKWTRARKARQG